jgi:CRP/FNR family cyclic AMP-dependent transcriptional regulator
MALGAVAASEPRQGRFGQARTVALLDLDPDLGAGLAPARLAAAAHELRARVVSVPRGELTLGDIALVNHQHVGLLVVEGVIAHEVVLEDTVSTELLGPGDFFRPWTEDGESPLLRQRVRWQVLADTRLGVLGEALGHALPRFPEVNTALLARACARAQRLATTQAISHLNSVDRRLLALFWHLAERWGRVTRDGVVVPLTISHRLLGELVGARRPTVTTALAALDHRGALRRRQDATWLLLEEPTGLPAHRMARAVSHRRRLLAPKANPGPGLGEVRRVGA